jgi:hypothetical protein
MAMSTIVPFAIMLGLIITLRTNRDGGIAHRPYGNQYTDAPGALDR